MGDTGDSVAILSLVAAADQARDFRHRHGLGGKYAITVSASDDRWRVDEASGRSATILPMPSAGWERWIERWYSEAVAERDETSEG